MGLSISKHEEKTKIFAISKEKCLVEIALSKGSFKVLDSYNSTSFSGCSYSEPINNRFIFILGGETADVFYYDLKDRKRYQGPPIHFLKWCPTLIILGCKLFAFSRVKGFFEDPEYMCEVLDTSSSPWEWCILNTLPKLPHPRPRRISSYIVVSYATYSSSIFLSIGNEKCSITYCYDDDSDRWSNFSESRLPFVGEGKFVVGGEDNSVGPICYAFPRNDLNADNSSYLVSYRLSIDWNTDAKVYCVELHRYFLPDTSSFQHPSRLYSFYAIELNLFTIVRTKFSADRTSSNLIKRYFLEVDDVLLLPSSLPSQPPPPSLLQSVSSSRFSFSSQPQPNVIGDSRSTRVLKHITICLPRDLEVFLGKFN